MTQNSIWRFIDGSTDGLGRLGGIQNRLFGGFIAICGFATLILFAAAFATAPENLRPAVFPAAGLVGAVFALAILFLKRGLSTRLFVAGSVAMMTLGIVVAASLPDGLDAAVILPLTGALLVLPVLRGRRLLLMFMIAFGASIVGEFVAQTSTWSLESPGAFNLPISIAASALMLAVAYGLVWWVSNEWLMASERSSHALSGQRQLLALNERFVATLDPDQVLNVIADSLKSLVAFDSLTIYRVDREANLLRPVLARDRFAALILDDTFELDRGITGWVVTHGEAQCVNDAQLDPRMALIPGTPAEDESLIIVPLMGHGEAIGTLNVGRMGGGPESHFDTADFEIVRLFASQASIALLNAEMHRAAWTRAETDALTGLRNRRAFDEQSPSVLDDRGAQPVTLLMLDLDGFKGFNDQYGHPGGDDLLRGVAQSITTSVRAGDRIYRYGGDEFAVLLPATDRAVGAQVAERVRSAIAALDPDTGSRVTASVGAASLPGDAAGVADLVAAADAALYRAKTSGGDKVVAAGVASSRTP